MLAFSPSVFAILAWSLACTAAFLAASASSAASSATAANGMAAAVNPAKTASRRVTVAGGVSGYPDLLALQSIEPSGVDSVVVGRALYENAFPCQRFWCWQRPQDVDLSRFSTARLALRGDA